MVMVMVIPFPQFVTFFFFLLLFFFFGGGPCRKGITFQNSQSVCANAINLLGGDKKNK
jgi:hypothetical protein